MKLVARILASVVLLFAVIISVASWYVMNAHPVALATINKVEIGAPAERVKSLLGSPRSMVDLDDAGQRWRYSGVTWCIVDVVFRNGVVVDVIHDH